MEKEILVAVDTMVKTEKLKIRIPEELEFYKNSRDASKLIALVPKYSYTINIVQVTRGRQEFTDFVPHNDCKDLHWLKSLGVGLKNIAFEIMTKEKPLWMRISEEEFYTEREKLLNVFNQ